MAAGGSATGSEGCAAGAGFAGPGSAGAGFAGAVTAGAGSAGFAGSGFAGAAPKPRACAAGALGALDGVPTTTSFGPPVGSAAGSASFGV